MNVCNGSADAVWQRMAEMAVNVYFCLYVTVLLYGFSLLLYITSSTLQDGMSLHGIPGVGQQIFFWGVKKTAIFGLIFFFSLPVFGFLTHLIQKWDF